MIIPENISFNDLVLNEIGIEFRNNILVDQDTHQTLYFNDKCISLFDHRLFKYHIFNPLTDLKLMTFLFNYFLEKIKEEDDIYVDVVYYKQVINSYKSPLALRANGKEYLSRIYNLESLKYLDLICQLNGGTDVDLSRYDTTNDT